MNEFALRFFGFPESEILGRSIAGTVSPATPAAKADLFSMIEELRRRPGRIGSNEYQHFRRDGEPVWIAWTNKAILDEHGEIAEILCVGNDISEMKRTSQAFRSIVEGTSGSGGEEFFRSLVRNLASALGARIALVGELSTGFASVQTIAVSAGGEIVNNFLYDLKGTPCGNVSGQSSCYYPAGIQELFPLDAMLREMDVHSYMGAPLVDLAGKPLGLIAVLDQRPIAEGFLEAESILKVFAARAGVELERLRAEQALQLASRRNQEMVTRLRALTARLESIREEERTSIAREIHDELGQQLTATRFDLVRLKSSLQKAAAQGDPVAPLLDRFTEITALVDSTIRQVRRIATELRPSVLNTFGLVAAIVWLAGDFQKRTGIHCVYEGPEDMETGSDLSTTGFRICQEALTNVTRHAAATEVTIRLRVENGWLLLEVRDNGKGVSEEALARTNSLGILGMRERAQIAGGEFDIVGSAGSGTTIVARLPLQALAQEAAAGDPRTDGRRNAL